jgi:hypothetical protein
MKVKAASTDKLLDSLPRNDAVAEQCYGKFNVKTTNTTNAKFEQRHLVVLYKRFLKRLLSN